MLILLSIKEEYMGEIGKGKNQTLKKEQAATQCDTLDAVIGRKSRFPTKTWNGQDRRGGKTASGRHIKNLCVTKIFITAHIWSLYTFVLCILLLSYPGKLRSGSY